MNKSVKKLRNALAARHDAVVILAREDAEALLSLLMTPEDVLKAVLDLLADLDAENSSSCRGQPVQTTNSAEKPDFLPVTTSSGVTGWADPSIQKHRESTMLLYKLLARMLQQELPYPGRLTLIYGDHGVGKTTLAVLLLSTACYVSRDTTRHAYQDLRARLNLGMFPYCEDLPEDPDGRVKSIIVEDPGFSARQMVTWLDHHPVPCILTLQKPTEEDREVAFMIIHLTCPEPGVGQICIEKNKGGARYTVRVDMRSTDDTWFTRRRTPNLSIR